MAVADLNASGVGAVAGKVPIGQLVLTIDRICFRASRSRAVVQNRGSAGQHGRAHTDWRLPSSRRS